MNSDAPRDMICFPKCSGQNFWARPCLATLLAECTVVASASTLKTCSKLPRARGVASLWSILNAEDQRWRLRGPRFLQKDFVQIIWDSNHGYLQDVKGRSNWWSESETSSTSHLGLQWTLKKTLIRVHRRNLSILAIRALRQGPMEHCHLVRSIRTGYHSKVKLAEASTLCWSWAGVRTSDSPILIHQILSLNIPKHIGIHLKCAYAPEAGPDTWAPCFGTKADLFAERCRPSSLRNDPAAAWLAWQTGIHAAWASNGRLRRCRMPDGDFLDILPLGLFFSSKYYQGKSRVLEPTEN